MLRVHDRVCLSDANTEGIVIALMPIDRSHTDILVETQGNLSWVPSTEIRDYSTVCCICFYNPVFVACLCIIHVDHMSPSICIQVSSFQQIHTQPVYLVAMPGR